MNRWLAALALSSLATPAVSQQIAAEASTRMQPAGQWTVEYAEGKCVLHRDFSTDGKRTLLSLSLEPLTSVAWMRIATEGGGTRRDSGDAVMFADGQRLPGTLHYNTFRAGRYQMREFMLDLEQHELGAVEERIRFWTRRHGDVEVQASGFPSAWNALNHCMSDLYDELGIVEAEVEQMAVEPKGEVLSFVDLPRRPSLDFALLYWVAADGRIDECRLLQPSGIEGFDQSLCSDLKEKARFEPARNAAGEPIRVPRFDNFRLRRATMTTTTPIRR